MRTLILLAQHGHGGRMDLVYFWSSILTILLPVAVFVALGVLTVRGYVRRKAPDGGGPPPMRNAEGGMRNGDNELPNEGHASSR
jgi:hypothetical protein